MFELKSNNIGMVDKSTNNKFSSFFEIEQVPNSRGLYEFVRWMDEGGIELSPDFQRGYVWSKHKASLLIESFLMNIPVPSIFMYTQEGKRHIIDGKQRLETIRRFIKNEWIDDKGNKSSFALDFEVDKGDENNHRQGLTIDTISDDDKLRLSDAFLMAVTIRATSLDENKRMDSIYYIFERLNTGGVSLTPSEIRLSLWNDSKLLQGIKRIANEDKWRGTVKITKKKARENQSYPLHERMESLLKIFAISNRLAHYKSPVKDFLTRFLRETHKNKFDFSKQIINLESIINNKDVQNLLKSFLMKKTIVIESVYIAILIAMNNNVEWTVPDSKIFHQDVFTKQGGTAQRSLVLQRVKALYKEITGEDLNV